MILTLTHARGPLAMKIVRLDLGSGEAREVGSMEGFAFDPGDTLTINRQGATVPLKLVVPAK